MYLRTNQSLTTIVEQAAEVLGIGRATAYDLVRTGDVVSVRLGRLIVVPVAHLAERLGVGREVGRSERPVRRVFPPRRPYAGDRVAVDT